MTVTVTEREIRSQHNGRVPTVDSPAAPARAGARLVVTKRGGKSIRVRVVELLTALRVGARRWWAWTARPSSLRAAWALSAVEVKRIPGKAGPLRILWKVSNATDRLVMFVLVMAAPTFATGPLRWLAARPTRRWGFYIVSTALAVTYLTGKG
jgi:hypothetical protein